MREIMNRGPGYWDGSRSSVGKIEAARRSGALSGMSMSGSPMDFNKRKVGFSNSSKKNESEKTEQPIKKIAHGKNIFIEGL